MKSKTLTIVTTTFNCIDQIAGYCESFASLDRELFDWILIDAGSKDGTAEFLVERQASFTHFVSEPDSGFYFGLNKAVLRIQTPYYMVFGADDRPHPALLQRVLPLLKGGPSLVLGAVRLMPVGRIKYPGSRFMHHIGWSQVISHHSVGTVIRTDTHRTHGMYDVRFSLLADGLHLKKILQSRESVLATRELFGDFMLGGMSSNNKLRAAAETFLIQVTQGSNSILQLILFNIRALKSIFATLRSSK